MKRSRKRGMHSVSIDVLEIYVPGRLAYLSGLYQWLERELRSPRSRALLHGFSIYDVNGAFRGRKRIYEERTLVVRLVFDIDAVSRERLSREERISEISRAIIRLTRGREETIWMLRCPGQKYEFRN